ncbi:hypothetical protein EV651_10911 [Kribbella sp. VKM Ac-2571]|uniref:hypothetical protein n=1 Tax=Kribbella sp. VKM Ac-2571 TaxID=2512222 RepID=UPI00105B84CF|nr:hypothetical protein [Kribbella sp. VKM Ac-2571]TDO58736.1 hypothetical protein EV651_10911 [Kribbella sp. VKM Ac-2571]
MSDLENKRVQRDAQRSAASRRSSSSTAAGQALIRHLGVEIYKERHQSEQAPTTTGDEAGESESEKPAGRSSDR